MNRVIAGAVAGCVATAPMTATMLFLYRRLPERQQYPLPPREVTQALLRRTAQERRLANHQITKLSLLAHFAYGAVTGALYASLFRSPRHPVMGGFTYGVSVWAASYLGWLPAANILKPATEHPRSRNALMLMAHLVWGAGTALVCKKLARPSFR